MDSTGHGPRRNNDLEARADVLTFTGAPLDAPVDVVGPVSVRLRARGSGGYFDLFARLCDVDASGTSWNVCDGIRRISGGADWAGYTVAMSSTAYRFAPGHRIRLQVSGGAHPRFARNSGTADQLPTATRLVPVDIELSHAEATLSLPFLPA
jgi:putative CocE/NonD family hydrolase